MWLFPASFYFYLWNIFLSTLLSRVLKWSGLLFTLLTLEFRRVIDTVQNTLCRSQWLRVVRRGSTAALLLRLWVRIPPDHGCLSVVNVVCCLVEVSASDWSLVQRSYTECDVSECYSHHVHLRWECSRMFFHPLIACSSTTSRPWPRWTLSMSEQMRRLSTKWTVKTALIVSTLTLHSTTEASCPGISQSDRCSAYTERANLSVQAHKSPRLLTTMAYKVWPVQSAGDKTQLKSPPKFK
jgi:hypothetical protein